MFCWGVVLVLVGNGKGGGRERKGEGEMGKRVDWFLVLESK